MAIVSSFSTAVQQVVVVTLVPQEGVVSALALNSATHNLTKVIGPSIGGLLLTVVGPGPCLLIQALTIGCMLIALFKLQPQVSSMASGKANWLEDIVEGVSYLRQNRRIFATILTTYSNGFFGISYAQFLPYFAQEVLHVGPSGYGLLVSAPGVGAVLISFFLSTHTRLRGMRRLLVGASLMYALAIFFIRTFAPFGSLDVSAGGGGFDANQLSSAGPGNHSGGMSGPSPGTSHESFLSRSRLWFVGRNLRRHRRGALPVSRQVDGW